MKKRLNERPDGENESGRTKSGLALAVLAAVVVVLGLLGWFFVPAAAQRFAAPPVITFGIPSEPPEPTAESEPTVEPAVTEPSVAPSPTVTPELPATPEPSHYPADGDITEEIVFALADEVIAGLGLDGLDGEAKVRKIYNWVKANVNYIPDSEKIGVLDGAYNAMKKKRGDCYTFYAIGEILLTRAGIENLMVERDSTRSNHYWSIIKIDGLWYHYDATPAKPARDTHCFTDAQAVSYTNLRGGWYYRYDHSLYPEVYWGEVKTFIDPIHDPEPTEEPEITEEPAPELPANEPESDDEPPLILSEPSDEPADIGESDAT